MPISYPAPPCLKRGTLGGTPHLTWPINGPIPWLQPWASGDRGQYTAPETQPQRFSPEILCGSVWQSCVAQFFSCLPLPGQVLLPGTPTSPCVRTSHLCLYKMSSNSHPPPALLWSLFSSTSEPLAPGCGRKPRPIGPGRLTQENWAGLGPLPQPEGCCLYTRDQETK